MITDEADKAEIPEFFTRGSPTIKVFQDLTVLSYNPFLARLIPRANFLSDKEAFFLLLNAVVGPSVMHMSMAFRSSGYTNGGIMIALATLFSIHGNTLWVRCIHEINYRSHVSSLGYGDVLNLTFGCSTSCVLKLFFTIQLLIQGLVILTNGWIATYYLAVANRMLKNALGEGSFIVPIIIFFLTIFIGLLPNWKAVAQVSLISVALRISSYLAISIFTAQQPVAGVQRTEEDEVLDFTKGDIYYRNTYALVLITSALQTIGLLPFVENNMKHPHHLCGKPFGIGINSVALALSALLHGACGYIGFSRFQEKNLCYYLIESVPKDSSIRSVTELVIAFSLLASLGSPLFIIYEILTDYTYNYFSDTPLRGVIILKVITSVAVLIGIFIVTNTTDTVLEAYLSYVVGAFCLILPAVLDNVLYWKKRRTVPYLKKPYGLTTMYIPVKKSVTRGIYWIRLLKNCIMCLAGVTILLISTVYLTTYEKEGKYDTQCRSLEKGFEIKRYNGTTSTTQSPNPG